MTLLGVIAVASIGEAAGVHLMVRRWSELAAWALTAFSIYGAVWIVALARSIVLRPVLVTADSLELRAGLLWSVTVPRSNIHRISEPLAPPDRGQAGYLRIGPLADPRFLIELKEPVVAEGPYGIRKRVSAIGLFVDEPAAFAARVSAEFRDGSL